ncbi:hypothetical protein Z950_3645 [Sulfitobacter mediterraneus KCTC 32188]|nr:hypothetical protein Z950_3645 [Sulfitobacter mediterraneus KCTC 32188]
MIRALRCRQLFRQRVNFCSNGYFSGFFGKLRPFARHCHLDGLALAR